MMLIRRFLVLVVCRLRDTAEYWRSRKCVERAIFTLSRVPASMGDYGR
jgi:hypothetical protein